MSKNLTLACSECGLLALNPHTCGGCVRLVCGSCVELACLDFDGGYRCGSCGDGVLSPNPFAKKWIGSLAMMCRMGCEKYLPADELKDHESACCGQIIEEKKEDDLLDSIK